MPRTSATRSSKTFSLSFLASSTSATALISIWKHPSGEIRAYTQSRVGGRAMCEMTISGRPLGRHLSGEPQEPRYDTGYSRGKMCVLVPRQGSPTFGTNHRLIAQLHTDVAANMSRSRQHASSAQMYDGFNTSRLSRRSAHVLVTHSQLWMKFL
jgi:hypothetical protein